MFLPLTVPSGVFAKGYLIVTILQFLRLSRDVTSLWNWVEVNHWCNEEGHPRTTLRCWKIRKRKNGACFVYLLYWEQIAPSTIRLIINVKKYLKLYYKSSLKYFGKVYSVLASCFFLDQPCFINGHFGHTWMELIRKKDQLWCLWDLLECQQRSSSKVMHVLYFISAFCVAPSTLVLLFTTGSDGCILSDNSFSCFRWKAF
jgi:hypothetical protein